MGQRNPLTYLAHAPAQDLARARAWPGSPFWDSST